MRQLFIITETPFTARDYQRFGIDYLENFFEVIVCDCTAWLQKKFWGKYKSTADQRKKYKVVANYRQLLSVPIYPGDVVIDCLGDYVAVNFFRKRLIQKKIILTKLQNGLYPAVSRSKRWGKSLKSLLLSPRKWLLQCRKRICALSYVPPTVLIVGGEIGLDTKDARHAKFNLLAHSFDYDIYLQVRMVSQKNNEKYIVFLDQDLARHSDFYFDNVRCPVFEDSYYHALDVFFTKIEKKLGMKVIFSAHPRADYSYRKHVLYGRSFYQGRTPQLVKNASLVLMHDTTSLSFAVLWYKPVIFLTTRALQKSMLGPGIQNVARIFNQVPVNINEDTFDTIEPKKIMHVDKACYDCYKNTYLKVKNSPDISTQELLVSFVNREFSGVME